MFIGGFTTSQARTHLYGYLRRLDGEVSRHNVHEARVLYFDTDSVVYRSAHGQEELPLGTLLGELTSELREDEFITTFVSAGPKNYAYETDRGVQSCKIKGFTLNYETSRLLNFRSLCDLVTCGEESGATPQTRIVCDAATRRLRTVRGEKKHRLVYDKRVRLPNSFITVPYGF